MAEAGTHPGEIQFGPAELITIEDTRIVRVRRERDVSNIPWLEITLLFCRAGEWKAKILRLSYREVEKISRLLVEEDGQ